MDETDSPFGMQLPMRVAAEAGERISFAWGTGCVLNVFKVVGRRADTRRCSFGDIHECRWASNFHQSDTLRRLAAESHRIFLTSQKLGSSEIGPDNREGFLQCSKEYRALLHDCCRELGQLASRADEEEAAFLENEAQLLAACQILWHLLEILWVAPRAQGHRPAPQVLLELLEWARPHSDNPNSWIDEMMEASDVGRWERHPRFWDSVYLLVLQGRTVEARNVLGHHSLAQPQAGGGASAAFKDALELLNVPKFSFVRSGHSVRDFDLAHCLWQKDVRVKLEAGLFSAHQELELLVELLAGDEDALARPHVVSLCSSWYQLLLSRLFLTNPTAGLEQLSRDAPEAVALYQREAGAELNGLDRMVQLLFDAQVGAFLREAADQVGGNWWFVSHATDLLQHCMPDCQLGASAAPAGGPDLREYFLLEYAQSMLGHGPLWQLAVSYYDYCPTLGRFYQEAVLARVPLDTQRKAYRVYEACESRGLTEAAATVARVLARRDLDNGCLGNALAWAIKARDSKLVSVIADKYLAAASDAPGGFGQAASADILDCLATCSLLSNRMAFLCQYKLFHDRLAAGCLGEAADLAVQLVSSRMIPRRYWLRLLQDAHPLLEMHSLPFTSAQLYDLMHALQEVRHLSEPVPTDKLSVIQSALNQALCRAMVAENFHS